MKIIGDIGKAITKLLTAGTSTLNNATSNAEIYEVEEWEYEVFNPNNISSYSEYFTTLEEAEQNFKEKAKFIIDSTEYNIQMSRTNVKYYKDICTLRKLKVSLGSDRCIEYIIKEVVATKTVYN